MNMKRQYWWNIFLLLLLILNSCSKEKTEFEIICDNLCGIYRLEDSGLGMAIDLDGDGTGGSTISELEGLPGRRNDWPFAQIVEDKDHPNTLIFIAQIPNIMTSITEDDVDIQVRYETIVKHKTYEVSEGKIVIPLFFGAEDPILAPNTYGLSDVSFTDIDINGHSFTIRGQNPLYNKSYKKLYRYVYNWCKYIRM